MISNAKILTLDEFVSFGPDSIDIALTSGGFAPIHPGHISCIQACKSYAPITIVIVNGDKFLVRKHGKAFQDIETRCQIVASLRGVDYVIPFDSDKDNTMNEPIRRIMPAFFVKGGDRADKASIPEWDTCEEVNTKIITGAGLAKLWSSSNFLGDWGTFILSKMWKDAL